MYYIIKTQKAYFSWEEEYAFKTGPITGKLYQISLSHIFFWDKFTFSQHILIVWLNQT